MLANVQTHRSYHFSVRNIAICAMLSAVASVLMFISFSVPLMPSFIKLDLSELPALLAAFTLGPVEGIVVCLVKNLVNLFFTTTAGVGELCNFLMGAVFTGVAGLIYQRRKTRRSAVVASLVGAAAMAVASVPINFFFSYPVYAAAFGGMDAIIAAYQELNPGMDSLLGCLIAFNLPFTLVKGLVDAALCFLIYKPLSPVLHGRVGRPA